MDNFYEERYIKATVCSIWNSANELKHIYGYEYDKERQTRFTAEQIQNITKELSKRLKTNITYVIIHEDKTPEVREFWFSWASEIFMNKSSESKLLDLMEKKLLLQIIPQVFKYFLKGCSSSNIFYKDYDFGNYTETQLNNFCQELSKITNINNLKWLKHSDYLELFIHEDMFLDSEFKAVSDTPSKDVPLQTLSAVPECEVVSDLPSVTELNDHISKDQKYEKLPTPQYVLEEITKVIEKIGQLQNKN